MNFSSSLSKRRAGGDAGAQERAGEQRDEEGHLMRHATEPGLDANGNGGGRRHAGQGRYIPISSIAHNVEAWSSLADAQILTSITSEFGLDPEAELLEAETIGDLLNILDLRQVLSG